MKQIQNTIVIKYTNTITNVFAGALTGGGQAAFFLLLLIAPQVSFGRYSYFLDGLTLMNNYFNKCGNLGDGSALKDGKMFPVGRTFGALSIFPASSF